MKQTTRVLIADDAEFIRTVLTKHLVEMGCEVVGVASDGKEATKLYFEEKPDLLLMDVQMPVMDGWEATRLILSKDKEANIVLVTGSSNPEDNEAKALQLGAKDFITKPIASTHVLATRLEKKGLLRPRLEEPTPVKKENGQDSPTQNNQTTSETISPNSKEEEVPSSIQENTISSTQEKVPSPIQGDTPSSQKEETNVPFVESPSIVETPTEPTNSIVEALNNMRPQRTVFLQEATEQQLEKQSDGPIDTKSNVSTNKEKKSLFSSLFNKLKS